MSMYDIEPRPGKKMEGLKTCPFCGSQPELKSKILNPESSHPTTLWWYQCSNTRCNGSQMWNKSVEAALENWNRRA